MQNSETITSMGMSSQDQKAELVFLKVDHMTAPLSIDDASPSFGWQMKSDRTGACQRAYRIRVCSGDELFWDSGIVESSDSAAIAYPGDAKALIPETDYQWEVQVTDETGAVLTASSVFSTGLMGTGLDSWHGAKWIGPDTISLAAETMPVFRIQFTMQIGSDGSRAGVVFGAADPRLLSSIHNNYLINGENYLTLCLNAGSLPAALEIRRKGYMPGEEEEKLIASIPVPASVIDENNRFEAHSFEAVICSSKLESVSIDGQMLETGKKDNGEPEYSLILNPLNTALDVPIFPRLCNVGFVTAENTEALFADFCIRHYGGERNVVFGRNTGASWRIFEGCSGAAAQADGIRGKPGTLFFADPSFGGMPMLRRDFEANGQVASAKVYVTARGIYEMTINGRKVGDEYLTPGDTDFRQHILYSAYDVTDLVREGENAMGAVLATGWYSDEASYDMKNFNFYGDRQAFLALLAVRYADGRTQYVPTDASWQCSVDGPVRYAANFNGETYDATLEAAFEGWDLPGFMTAQAGTSQGSALFKAATLMDECVCGVHPVITARLDTGIRKYKELSAAFVSKQVRGSDNSTVFIYDMGENMVGIPRIVFPEGCGQAGREVTIRYSEKLYPELDPENPYCYGDLKGLILTENLRGALVTDRYIMKGEGTEVFCPVFTFHGYQYVEISGLDEPIPAENITGLVLSSVTQTSHYESSNPLTNRLFTNIIRSTLGNHLSIPTDCPQRDERLGWAGDANVYSETATYMADMSAFLRNYSLMQRDSQDRVGTYHLFAPSYATIGESFSLGYAWNAAGVVLPFEAWLQYADIKYLRENYEAYRLHVTNMMEKKAPGCSYLTADVGFSADHLAVVPTDIALLSNAMLYRVARFVQAAAQILQSSAPEDSSACADYARDAELFKAYADGLKTEWNAVYVGEDHRTRTADGQVQDTQSSYSLPLVCGVFSDENLEYAGQFLDEACKKTGYTMTTGFMGTGPLLPALTEGGYIDTVYRLFEQTAYPSWLYPVVNGATSVWERWNSFTIENGFGGQNSMNSFNHYSLGAVGTWMMEYQAGIQRDDTAGFKSFILQPVPGGNFTFVDGSYDSGYGTIRSSWKAEDGHLTSYDATVPANTSAVLYLPTGDDDVTAFAAQEGVTCIGTETRFGRKVSVFKLTSGKYHYGKA